LRHGEDLPSGFDDRSIHLAGIVLKDAQSGDTPCEKLRVFGCVFLFDAEQDKYAGADARMFLPVDYDART